jgi:hypothetical protein
VITKVLDSVGFEVLTEVVLKSSTFWNITPCCFLKVERCFRETYDHLQDRRKRINHYKARKKFLLPSCLAYSWTLKIEATCSSKTYVCFQRATWCYMLKDTTLLDPIFNIDGNQNRHTGDLVEPINSYFLFPCLFYQRTT